MKAMRIKDVHDITCDIERFGTNDTSVIIIGYYDTIIEVFNTLIKETDSKLVEGELASPEWDGYDEAYYIWYSESNMYVSKAYNEECDSYYLIDCDIAFVEEDFLEDYLEDNSPTNVITFGWDDVIYDNEDKLDAFRFSADQKSFSFTYLDSNEDKVTFVYSGEKRLTEQEAWEIFYSYFS